MKDFRSTVWFVADQPEYVRAAWQRLMFNHGYSWSAVGKHIIGSPTASWFYITASGAISYLSYMIDKDLMCRGYKVMSMSALLAEENPFNRKVGGV